jgi:uncharacterized protein
MSVRLEIIAKPGARAARITQRGGEVVVAVRERAVDGKANEAIVRAVADWLGVAPSGVLLMHGALGRRKLLAIEAVGGVTLRERIATLTEG